MTHALLPAAVFALIGSSAAADRPATSSCDNPALAEGTYIPLDIDIPGASFISVSAINGRRDVLGRFQDETSVTKSFLWRDGVSTIIAVPGAAVTEAQDLNASGTVVGRYQDEGGLHAFTWRDGTFTLYPSSPSFRQLDFDAVNASGAIAGSYTQLSGDTVAFLRRPSGATEVIDVPGRPWDFAVSINERGDVLLLSFDEPRPGAGDYFLATNRGLEPIAGCGFLNDVADTLSSVTNQRQFVGRTMRFGGVSGIVYSRADVTVYDYPGASYTDLVDMNSAGYAIGHARFGDNFLDSQPFLFVPTGR
jgi:hypothetical protein